MEVQPLVKHCAIHPTAAKPGHYCIVSSPVDRLWKSDGYFSSDGPGHSYRQHYKETGSDREGLVYGEGLHFL